MFAHLWKQLRRWGSEHAASADPLNERAVIGKWGELRAARWLQEERNMRLITRNWRSGRGELDLIMEDRGVLVFVEVRTRQGAHPRTVFASVNKKKKRPIRQTAKAYLQGLRASPQTIRFDVVVVDAKAVKGEDVYHYEGVKLFGRDFRP